MTAFSTAVVYRFSHWGDVVCKRLLDKVTPPLDKGAAISLVAHSLGTAVVFDAIYYGVNASALRESGLKPANLFTLCSQIATFTMELAPQENAADVAGLHAAMTAIPLWQELLR